MYQNAFWRPTEFWQRVRRVRELTGQFFFSQSTNDKSGDHIMLNSVQMTDADDQSLCALEKIDRELVSIIEHTQDMIRQIRSEPLQYDFSDDGQVICILRDFDMSDPRQRRVSDHYVWHFDSQIRQYLLYPVNTDPAVYQRQTAIDLTDEYLHWIADPDADPADRSDCIGLLYDACPYLESDGQVICGSDCPDFCSLFDNSDMYPADSDLTDDGSDADMYAEYTDPLFDWFDWSDCPDGSESADLTGLSDLDLFLDYGLNADGSDLFVSLTNVSDWSDLIDLASMAGMSADDPDLLRTIDLLTVLDLHTDDATSLISLFSTMYDRLSDRLCRDQQTGTDDVFSA